MRHPTAEHERLWQDDQRRAYWRRWGPYVSDRQWGTVREDYSADGNAWAHFPFDHAHLRTYRWGEDAILGLCDRQGRLHLAPVLWNGRDPILKERLFGLSGPEGNHGEDPKELWYHLDATPTHAWLEALYKYPQRPFPVEELRRRNRAAGRHAPEVELLDTDAFDEDRYFDVRVQVAKQHADDLAIRYVITNRGPEAAPLHVLAQLWWRNTWSWGRFTDGYWPKPAIHAKGGHQLVAEGMGLGRHVLVLDDCDGVAPELLFTDNETNLQALYGVPNKVPFVKDAFHRRIVEGRRDAVNPALTGTKAAAWWALTVPAGATVEVRLRLYAAHAQPEVPFGPTFDDLFERRKDEADRWHAFHAPPAATPEEARVERQAIAGLVWTRQCYHFVVKDWLEGDAPAQPAPPPGRDRVRNGTWAQHLFNRDVISMPDKWEYPWYAAWDLAFHAVPFARIDPAFAKNQIELFLREWYMHPNGQIPAYEWNFSDVNPPVHAWAAWRIYKLSAPRGQRDRRFLAHVFQKLLLNFTWWVNRKGQDGRGLFAGGFLGLDNIGVFDRSKPLPGGGTINQADGTAWMAFFCTTMLAMALELADEDPAYEDLASKFFEHFVHIADAINTMGGDGLWDEADGFYYDALQLADGREVPLRLRSMVGIVPLFAVEALEDERLSRLPGFRRRMQWFLDNRPDLARHVSYLQRRTHDTRGDMRLLAIPTRERLVRVLTRLFDEDEFLSPHGVRSLSKVYDAQPFELRLGGQVHVVRYAPGDSDTAMFGGNSNWRGPVWFPTNLLLIEALERYHYFFGDDLQVEFPTGSGKRYDLRTIAAKLSERLSNLFLPGPDGRRPCHGDEARYARDPAFRDLILFYEHFHGDDGRGIGAPHQTGWTALVLECLRKVSAAR